MTKKHFPLLLILLVLTVNSLSQQTAIYTKPEAVYRNARDLFDKQQYGAARQLFLQTKELTYGKDDQLHANAALYAAVCATELFNPDAEKMLLAFVQNHQTHTGQKLAHFHLGNIKYRQRKYDEAASWYANLEVKDIDQRRRDEFSFKKAYSNFMNDEFDIAKTYFEKITDRTSAYYSPASYYYGHIAYLRQEHDTALEYFKALTDDHRFGEVVPYYIAHIYFLEKRFDDLLDFAPALLKEATPRRAPEIARLIGEAYAEKSQYEEAIPYLEAFMKDRGAAASTEDHYQTGFAYFITGEFEKAIPHFERVTTANNALAQNAYFHLGYSYIQTDQKRFARNAFMQAYQLGFLDDITRESLFQYALLSFELAYDPYSEAIPSFQKYINDYPDSPRLEEAYGYLVDLYLTTRNYKDALESLENTTHDTQKLREAYQRVSYLRGVELFNNGEFANAITHFAKTQRYNDNQSLVSLALFWTGEAHYRLGQFSDARKAHEKFLKTPNASSLSVYHHAHYSIGYTYFKQESYSQAIQSFRRFISARDQDRRLTNDAVLRIADGYFINKDYKNAMEFYDRAINMNVIDTDYAVFQKGLVFGIMGNFEEKIASMRRLINNHPNSSFIDDAKYETANSWLILDNSAQAKNFFRQVIDQHPNSNYVQSAMLKTGLIHYNNNEDELAIESFLEVVNRFPATTQAQEALAAIQIIYVGLDRVEEYVKLTEQLGIADMTAAEQDSLTYQAAENRYMQGDCTNAIQSFSNYIDRFPNGIFAVNAHFYRAECYFRANDLRPALSDYQFVVEAPRSMFLENALLRASGIHFHFQDFDNALTAFKLLEKNSSYRNNLLIAREGIMRSYYKLQKHNEAVIAAESVLKTEKLQPETEQSAHLIRGLSAMADNQINKAIESFTRVKNITENENAARAMYSLALISFNQEDYETAEEQIFEYVNKITAYEYWLARMFLLLADVYFEKDNTFQAKHTLQSLIDNYDGEDIRNEAINRLEFIEELEKMLETPVEKDSIEIELGTMLPE